MVQILFMLRLKTFTIREFVEQHGEDCQISSLRRRSPFQS
jgi:hypothetical protein